MNARRCRYFAFFILHSALALFFILHSSFFIQPVRAQACIPPASVECRGVCVEPAMNSGSACPGSGGQTGTWSDCGTCTNLSCPQTPVAQRFCNGTCTQISTIPTDACTTESGQEGTRDNCGTCVASGPRAATRQYGSYPGVAEDGFIHVVGDISSGGNMYLNSGRAIRIDNASGSSVLNLGNYVGGGTEFHATLHAQGTNLTELIFQQGSDDRWALSARPGATSTAAGGDFEIRRGTTGWPRVLAIDYNTGNLTLDTDVAIGGALNVSGTLTVGGATVLTNVTAPAGSGITVTGTGATRQVAVSGCVAGQVLKRAAGGATWECAEDELGAAGVTDHGLLEAASLLDNDHPQYYRQTGDLRNLTIGGDLLSNTLYSRGSGADNIWLGDVNDSIRVLGDLRFGPDATPQCTENQILKRNVGGTAWVCAADVGSSYTAGDYVTIGADNRISATHDGGCFGPIFAGVTSDPENAIDPYSTTGVIWGVTPGRGRVEAAPVGYRGGHDRCVRAFTGSHMCSTQEILNSVSCGTSAGTSAVFQALPPAADGGPGRAWISNGAPALPTQTNDCNGWTFGESSATVNGVAWQLNANGGVGWAQTCNSSFPIACCR